MNLTGSSFKVEQTPRATEQFSPTPAAENLNVSGRNSEAPAARPEVSAARPEAPLRTAEYAPTAERSSIPTVPVAATPAKQPSQQAVASAAIADDPDDAADTDKIEKEWVNKAKRELVKHADDPYMQQLNISAMMRDYVKKRFGRIVGKAPEL